MTNEIVSNSNSEIVSQLVLEGDLSKMTPKQKVQYYNSFCQSLGLNSLTQPFQIINFQGKQRLYATKDCTEQLRKIHGVSITDVSALELRGVYVVTAKAQDKAGKTDASTGAVSIENLKGDALANALMKAETKAKRRVTLSICGLGILDETETDTIPGAKTEEIPHEEVKPEPLKVVPQGVDHTTIGTATMPLISNHQLKLLCERIEKGDIKSYYNAIAVFSFESTQRRLIDRLFNENKPANNLKTA